MCTTILEKPRELSLSKPDALDSECHIKPHGASFKDGTSKQSRNLSKGVSHTIFVAIKENITLCALLHSEVLTLLVFVHLGFQPQREIACLSVMLLVHFLS